MSTPAAQVARTYVAPGTVWDVARNRDHTTGAGALIPQDIGATTDRPGVWLQWVMLAGFPVAHGEVADEAAMLALHTFAMDSADNPSPRYVAPGDSCLRTDDPGWRWVCLSGHGLTLADWERRPLAGALSGFAATVHAHTRAQISDASTAGRALMAVDTPSTARLPLIHADNTVTLIDVPSGGGGASLPIARLTRSTNWDFAALAGIPWQACETFVGAGMWESGTPSRLYAPSAGLWRVSAWLRTSGVTAILFQKNGVNQALGWRGVWNGAQTEVWTYDCVMSVGDYLEVTAYSSGTVLYIEGNTPLCTWQQIG